MMGYILIGIGPQGLRCAKVDEPKVPENWTRPGDLAFVIHVLDFEAKAVHETVDG